MCESDPAMKHVFMTIAQALEKSHAASVETTNKFLTHVTEPFADYTGYPASMRVRPLGCIEMRLTRLVVLVRFGLYRTRQPIFCLVQETQRFRDLMQLYKEVRCVVKVERFSRSAMPEFAKADFFNAVK